MSRMFGTDGVRGVANTELSPLLAFQLGYYGAKVLAGRTAHRPRILVGNDSRISSDMLQAALVAGITACGADAYIAGVIPTPGVAYLTESQGFDAGVMISASHNSYEFNGIKFFNSKGFKLADAVEDEIEAGIKADPIPEFKKTGDELGRSLPFDQGVNIYIQHLKDSMGLDLSGLRVAMDCANGAASYVGPTVFRELGAIVVSTAAQPDGININNNCGSTHIENLCEMVKREGCDLGLAFDGDADRMLAVDGTGTVMDGDKIMLIIADYLRKRDQLPQDTLVITVMSNLGLRIAAKQQGLNLAITKVGDRYVLEEMQEKGFGFGGEQSGHLIILAEATTGDGVLSALALMRAVFASERSLTELQDVMRIYPQVLVPAFIPNDKKSAAMADEEILAQIDAVSTDLGDDGRILVRPSGTEPQIRVMIEGDDLEKIGAYAKSIADAIVAKYGA